MHKSKKVIPSSFSSNFQRKFIIYYLQAFEFHLNLATLLCQCIIILYYNLTNCRFMSLCLMKVVLSQEQLQLFLIFKTYFLNKTFWYYGRFLLLIRLYRFSMLEQLWKPIVVTVSFQLDVKFPTWTLPTWMLFICFSTIYRLYILSAIYLNITETFVNLNKLGSIAACYLAHK